MNGYKIGYATILHRTNGLIDVNVVEIGEDRLVVDYTLFNGAVQRTFVKFSDISDIEYSVKS